MHWRERHHGLMGLFVDFWVAIPEFPGDMKSAFLCVVLLLCFPTALV